MSDEKIAACARALVAAKDEVKRLDDGKPCQCRWIDEGESIFGSSMVHEACPEHLKAWGAVGARMTHLIRAVQEER